MLDLKNIIGQKAIIRGESSGVQYGTIKQVQGQTVEISDSRRIWYWSGAASLSELAVKGVKYPKNCKFSVRQATPHIITDVIEILICSEEAKINIEEVPEWKA